LGLSNYIVPMLTKIVPIGNSRGIRIPKAMLETCGFGEEVELQAKNGALILRPGQYTAGRVVGGFGRHGGGQG
jgi:virulence-associated protein VagC